MRQLEHQMSLKWPVHSAADTHTGYHRARNEDAWLDAGYQGMWVVADGMGHDGRGSEASRLAIEALKQCSLSGDLYARASAVKQTLAGVHEHLCYEKTGVNGSFPGTTVVVVLIHRGQMLCLWAGDSRCYLLRRGQLHQLTQDHSPTESRIKQGQITREEAARQPRQHGITHAVGAGRNAFKTESIEMPLAASDTLLLCTDGLYQMLNKQTLVEGMLHTEVREGVQQLMTAGLRTEARDNLTAMIVKVKHS